MMSSIGSEIDCQKIKDRTAAAINPVMATLSRPILSRAYIRNPLLKG